MLVYHLVQKAHWEQVDKTYAPPSLTTEGFIHFSTKEQVHRTYNRFYANQEMYLLSINTEKLLYELKFESADGELFPHLYGPLNLDAIDKIEEYSPGWK